jgi:hypothetical protein
MIGVDAKLTRPGNTANNANTNNNNANTANANAAQTTNAGSKGTQAANANSNSASITNGPQGSQSGSLTASPTVSANSTSVDPRQPAGGISMITPNPTMGAQYYKIGDWVTFAWNYTSLVVTPTAVNIVASCSVNQQTYTIAANQSVQATGAVLWDTSSYQQANSRNQLLTNDYTLIVFDAASQISATPRAGYLGTYNQFVFGMYQPEPYQNWTCKLPLDLSSLLTLKRSTVPRAAAPRPWSA